MCRAKDALWTVFERKTQWDLALKVIFGEPKGRLATTDFRMVALKSHWEKTIGLAAASRRELLRAQNKLTMVLERLKAALHCVVKVTKERDQVALKCKKIGSRFFQRSAVSNAKITP